MIIKKYTLSSILLLSTTYLLNAFEQRPTERILQEKMSLAQLLARDRAQQRQLKTKPTTPPPLHSATDSQPIPLEQQEVKELNPTVTEDTHLKKNTASLESNSAPLEQLLSPTADLPTLIPQPTSTTKQPEPIADDGSPISSLSPKTPPITLETQHEPLTSALSLDKTFQDTFLEDSKALSSMPDGDQSAKETITSLGWWTLANKLYSKSTKVFEAMKSLTTDRYSQGYLQSQTGRNHMATVFDEIIDGMRAQELINGSRDGLEKLLFMMQILEEHKEKGIGIDIIVLKKIASRMHNIKEDIIKITDSDIQQLRFLYLTKIHNLFEQRGDLIRELTTNQRIAANLLGDFNKTTGYDSDTEKKEWDHKKFLARLPSATREAHSGLLTDKITLSHHSSQSSSRSKSTSSKQPLPLKHQ